MRTTVSARNRMYVSTALVDGEHHLILRQHRTGWRGFMARFLRKHWSQYARAEGGTLMGTKE